MKKREDDEIVVDNHTLRYIGKVIPIRNIAYFEKFKVKKKKGITKILFITIIVGILAAIGVSLEPRSSDEFIAAALSFLGIVYLIWSVSLVFKRRKFALVLQTNAGDSPRLFTTSDESFLDKLIYQLTIRLESNTNLPPLVANIRNSTINYGDKVMGDKFENISGSTIVNRSLVKDSFVKVKETFDEDTALAIQKLADFIEQSGNKEAAELFNEFNKEASKKDPRKSILRTLWSGVTSVLPTVSTLGDVIIKIMKIIG
jgi:hypothetical protein